jgi:hypothetical protein
MEVSYNIRLRARYLPTWDQPKRRSCHRQAPQTSTAIHGTFIIQFDIVPGLVSGVGFELFEDVDGTYGEGLCM